MHRPSVIKFSRSALCAKLSAPLCFIKIYKSNLIPKLDKIKIIMTKFLLQLVSEIISNVAVPNDINNYLDPQLGPSTSQSSKIKPYFKQKLVTTQVRVTLIGRQLKIILQWAGC